MNLKKISFMPWKDYAKSMMLVSLLTKFSLVLEDQKYLQRTELLAVVHAAFVLGHEDHEPSLPSIPDNSVSLRRCVHAGFLQNDGTGTLWNGEILDIWTSPDSFAQEFFSLLEVTIVC